VGKELRGRVGGGEPINVQYKFYLELLQWIHPVEQINPDKKILKKQNTLKFKREVKFVYRAC
jgi:hypothetical protein